MTIEEVKAKELFNKEISDQEAKDWLRSMLQVSSRTMSLITSPEAAVKQNLWK